jgi:hypothetical protein
MHPSLPNECVPITNCWGLNAGPPPSTSVLAPPSQHLRPVTYNDLYTVILPPRLVVAALVIYSRRLRRFLRTVIFFAFFLNRP